MGADQGPTERFTAEELAFLRHAQFGELPPRIPPDELVAGVEAERPEEPPTWEFDAVAWGATGPP
jgi:hypothetical protein